MSEQSKIPDRLFYIGLGLVLLGGLFLYLPTSSPSFWGFEWLLYPPIISIGVGIVMMVYYNFREVKHWVKKETKPAAKSIGFLIVCIILLIVTCPAITFMVLWPGF